MNFLEKILEEKVKDGGIGEKKLNSQWTFDKERYVDTLNRVGNSYPHYTDHGPKHSEKIIENIIRMFGEEKMRALSATDIWLILEAAYLHDCGMHISSERLEELLVDKDFHAHLRYIQGDEIHPLHEQSQKFTIDDGKINYQDKLYSSEKEYTMKFLIADYSRGNHAKDSRYSLGNYELLPKRFEVILYEIVKAHNYSFEEVEKKLPLREKGVGLSDCHPRFVAYLLRIGDLLDIDSDRMSPIILKDLGNFIPNDSAEHIEKHRSITHFRLDNEQIEVTAFVPIKNDKDKAYEVAWKLSDWFNYIKEEQERQLRTWEQVKPKDFEGRLPTVGNLYVGLEGYEFIEGSDRIAFSVDTNNILELLQGSNFYKDKHDALRELIQNAVDATLIRAFLDNKDKFPNDDKATFKEQVEQKKILKDERYKLEVDFDRIEEECNDEVNCHKISIRDRGVGIGKKDFEFIRKAGSSYNNREKQKIIAEMPEWLRPSGNFGIGFQSIFMLTDEIEIKSRTYKECEVLHAIISDPAGKNKGRIIFKTDRKSVSKEIGTEVSFKYKTKIFPKNYDLNKVKGELYTLSLGDDILEPEPDLDLEKAKNEIKEAVENILFKCELNKNNSMLEQENKITPKKKEQKKIKRYTKYGLEITVNKDRNMNIYYKNQKLKDYDFNNTQIGTWINYVYSPDISYWNDTLTKLEPFGFEANIVMESAKELLNIDRNSLKKEVEGEINKKIISAMIQYIIDFKDDFEDCKTRVGFFLIANEAITNTFKEDKDLLNNFKNEMLGYSLLENIAYFRDKKDRKGEFTIRDLLEMDEFSFDYEFANNNIKELNMSLKGNLYITILEILVKLQSYKLDLSFSPLTLKYTKVESRKDEELTTNTEKEKLFVLDIDAGQKNSLFLKRPFILIQKPFKGLRLKNISYSLNFSVKNKWIVKDIVFSPLTFSPTNRSIPPIPKSFLFRNICLLPFSIGSREGGYKINASSWNENTRENYIDFHYENRADENLTRDDIAQATDEFVEYLKKELEITEIPDLHSEIN